MPRPTSSIRGNSPSATVRRIVSCTSVSTATSPVEIVYSIAFVSPSGVRLSTGPSLVSFRGCTIPTSTGTPTIASPTQPSEVTITEA